MPSKVTASFIDHDLELSTVNLTIETLEETNFDEIVGVGGTIDTVMTAVAAVTLGTYAKKTVTALVEEISSTVPTSVYAQRESKWLVSYADTVTNKKYQMTIPNADLSLKAGNTKFMNVAAGAGATLVSALESGVRAPDTGNTIEVLSIYHVGRNL